MVWTVSEIAKETELTARHITRLLKNGAIVGEKKPAGWLVADEEAQRFISERKQKKQTSDES